MKYFPAAGLAIFTVAFLAAAYTYPSQARTFPVAVAWVTLFLLALDITKSRFNPTAAGDPRPLGSQIGAVIWLAVFAVLLVLIGILYAVPLYIFTSLRFRGSRSRFTSLWIAAVVTGGIWLLFAVVLRLELYPGYFFAPR